MAFALPDGASIPLVRSLVERVAAGLEDCRTLISGDRNGYIYSLLGQEMGFSCWTSEGSLGDQLAMVERRQLELSAEQSASGCAITSCPSSGCGGRKASACGPEIEAPPPEPASELLEAVLVLGGSTGPARNPLTLKDKP